MGRYLLPVLLVISLSLPAFTRTGDESPTTEGVVEGEVVSGSLGRQLDKYLASSGFSGAAMVVRNNKLVLMKGYGTADRGRKLPTTHQTLLHVGSVTKQFTGAAILKLEMEGKLRVSDPITKYFKDVPADKRSITIHHLLTHTAGFPHQVGRCSSKEAEVGRDDYVRQVLAFQLQTVPGQVYSYSNDGYGLLGAIVEIVSGETYEQYLRGHLFGPAGMKDTGSYAFSESQLARAARGYQGDKDFMGVLNPAYRSAGGPAYCVRASGGMLTTAGDMYRWYLALRGTRVLSAQAKEKLFAPHVPEGPERTSFYGYGWTLFTTRRKTRLIAHNGGIGEHFYADLRLYADEGVAYFIAGNVAEHNALDASNAIDKIIFPPAGKKAAR